MFCSGLSGKLKKVVHDITEKIEDYANYALSLTGILKDNITGDLGTLVAILIGRWGIEKQAEIAAALEKASTDIGIVQDALGKDLETQLSELAKALMRKTAYEKNALLIKLASRIVAHMDGDSKKEHFYDTVVQGAALK